MSLIEHAERELKLAGLDKKDSDYGGMLYDSTLKLIKCFADEGHSGMSAMMQIDLFRRLASFQNLTPLTNNPDEWMEVGTGGPWQSRRNSECFTTDMKYYYNLNKPKEFKKIEEANMKQAG
jgi:hypothetical protein